MRNWRALVVGFSAEVRKSEHPHTSKSEPMLDIFSVVKGKGKGNQNKQMFCVAFAQNETEMKKKYEINQDPHKGYYFVSSGQLLLFIIYGNRMTNIIIFNLNTCGRKETFSPTPRLPTTAVQSRETYRFRPNERLMAQ